MDRWFAVAQEKNLIKKKNVRKRSGNEFWAVFHIYYWQQERNKKKKQKRLCSELRETHL